MAGAKWMTSGAQRLKANLDRSFGSRKKRKDSQKRRSGGVIDLRQSNGAMIMQHERSRSEMLQMSLQENDSNIAPNQSGSASSELDGRSMAAASTNPFLLQPEMARRQELALLSASAGFPHSFGHGVELDALSRRESDLLRLRNAYSQMMDAGPSTSIYSSGLAAESGATDDDPFRAESIEGIVSLQEQRRREIEHIMGLPGHQLGEQTFNLLQHQIQPLVNGRNLHNHERRSQNAVMRNPALAEGAGRQPLAHYSNAYYQMLMQQQQQLDLMRMQQQVPANQLLRNFAGFPPSLNLPASQIANGFGRFQVAGANALSEGSAGESNFDIHTPNVNRPALQAILVRDKLRYFNNGIEVDTCGRPIPIQNQNANISFACLDDNKPLSDFVNLVLNNVPEMTHIMAQFLSSLKAKEQTESTGDTRQQNLSSVISMALSELNSIDQNDLDSIDPKCSDLASRVIKCVSDIEAYKKKVEEEASSSCSPKPQSRKVCEDTVSEPKSKEKNKMTETKNPNDGDIHLKKHHKQMKKKSSKKSETLLEEQSNHEGHIKREGTSLDTTIAQMKMSGAAISNSNKPESNEGNTLTNSKPPKKRKVEITAHEDMNTASGKNCEQAPTQSNGPHGDLLGLLFSGKESITKSQETAKKKDVAGDENVRTVSESSNTIEEADDDKLSVAGVLLGLGK